MADGIRGVRSLKWEGGGVGMKWLVMLSRLNFFTLSPAKETFFLRSLNNMLVSFRVKDSSQTASNSPCSVYSGVAASRGCQWRGNCRSFHFVATENQLSM